ncbi:hypothetical protein [Thalassobacillus sp. C254]|uniref:hypothetical protein n=1 Tax=Thalassobacillus sp. C254 TaxID=1225341 RepID=UPI0006CFC0C3|nr:hypothetical protein [Thalassobacillus sp. C254]
MSHKNKSWLESEYIEIKTGKKEKRKFDSSVNEYKVSSEEMEAMLNNGLNKQKYLALKEVGKSDKDIMNEFRLHSVKFYGLKEEWDLKGVKFENVQKGGKNTPWRNDKKQPEKVEMNTSPKLEDSGVVTETKITTGDQLDIEKTDFDSSYLLLELERENEMLKIELQSVQEKYNKASEF